MLSWLRANKQRSSLSYMPLARRPRQRHEKWFEKLLKHHPKSVQKWSKIGPGRKPQTTFFAAGSPRRLQGPPKLMRTNLGRKNISADKFRTVWGPKWMPKFDFWVFFFDVILQCVFASISVCFFEPPNLKNRNFA